ncbi:MAG: L,D-transpeptidase [Syntrophobacteraceae bacterium]
MLGKFIANRGVSLFALLLLSGCAVRPVPMQEAQYLAPYEEEREAPAVRELGKSTPSPKQFRKPEKKDLSTVHRRITEKELRQIEEKDPNLGFYRLLEILCRLNKKDKEYIREDMKHKKPLVVPKDFYSYRDWSPLPAHLTGVRQFPKFILVVKNIPFIGWYERGKLVGDTYICIGKQHTWTKRGMYRIKEKDSHHMSYYPNAHGDPSLMPHAMRVYDRVWIHTGDIIGPNCSHGCINVPLYHAEKLFSWTEIGTAVLITESLKDLGRDTKLGFTPDKKETAPVKSGHKETSQQTNF